MVDSMISEQRLGGIWLERRRRPLALGHEPGLHRPERLGGKRLERASTSATEVVVLRSSPTDWSL